MPSSISPYRNRSRSPSIDSIEPSSPAPAPPLAGATGLPRPRRRHHPLRGEPLVAPVPSPLPLALWSAPAMHACHGLRRTSSLASLRRPSASRVAPCQLSVQRCVERAFSRMPTRPHSPPPCATGG
ncbi:hypothetical protein QYE76_049170 [Lolium multiflorum]|uniref:Uncharacterized protein n=1 Tax=Lolium multiflorum TaxID=4521 RepID=A0AAD8SPG8_LOLMU|nr:hypothetical protein QYE76_049170 [Lolium multiflorum]